MRPPAASKDARGSWFGYKMEHLERRVAHFGQGKSEEGPGTIALPMPMEAQSTKWPNRHPPTFMILNHH